LALQREGSGNVLGFVLTQHGKYRLTIIFQF